MPEDNSDISQQFEKKLSLFRTEVTIAEDCYFMPKTIHLIISADKSLYAEVNCNALFWQTLLNSCQVNLFITLSRIFDSNEKSYSIRHLLQACVHHMELFSKDHLYRLKLKALSSEAAEKYVRDLPDELATDLDFRLLTMQVESCIEIFRKNYKNIRNKLFAHRDLSYLGKEKELFSKTMIGEIEAILDFLNRGAQALFDLYHNGRSLDVNLTESTDYKERIIEHTEKVLKSLQQSK